MEGHKHSVYSTFPVREDWILRKQPSETAIKFTIYFKIMNRNNSFIYTGQDALQVSFDLIFVTCEVVVLPFPCSRRGNSDLERGSKLPRSPD